MGAITVKEKKGASPVRGKATVITRGDFELATRKALQKAIDIEEVIDKLRAGMNATKEIKENMNDWRKVPDWPSRIKAIQLYLEHTAGKPLLRTETVEKKEFDQKEFLKMAEKQSFRDGLRTSLDMLDEADAEKGNPLLG